MATSSTELGTCPRCGEGLPGHRLLIEYERSDGSAAYVECPSCENVVHPVPG